ncbi:MAG: response regulator [Desulfobacteraceae bacterium]|nr:response regulator [Desulfobacteraceae bacterium]
MKILIIDDDEWIRDSLRIFFETEGCHVVVLETAEEGLVELKYQNFDLIIVDYKLPGLDGIEFLKRTHDEHSDTMKVLITAYRTDSVISEARKLKIQGFIQKPFTSESLMDSLAHLMEMREFKKAGRADI